MIQIRIKSKTKNKTCRKLYGHDETEISPKLNKKSCLLIAQSYVDGELVGLNQARLCRVPSNNPSSCRGLLCLGFTGDEKITVCSCGHQSALLKGQKWYNILGIIHILQTQIFQCALKFFYIWSIQCFYINQQAYVWRQGNGETSCFSVDYTISL